MSKANRGFASMDKQRQREIAVMGGVAAHKSGRAHEFTSEEAREAGRRGGRSRQKQVKERKDDERERTTLPASEEQIQPLDAASTSELPDA
jgi:uncharacterized protein